jgi:hypothetical protein
MKKTTVELAYFKAADGISQEQIVEASKKMEETLHKWNGFGSRELVYLGNNQYVDIVHWDEQKYADEALKKAMECKVCLDFFALLKESEDPEKDMQHGIVLLKQ